MKIKNSLIFSAALLTCLLPLQIFSQDIPDKPTPPRLVNDLAGLLTSDEAIALENKLVAFNDSTSTQIAIVIVKDLAGYDKADYAQRLGEKWGIGQKGSDNGLLILVKPKTEESSGQVYISQGYGLEGAIPDLFCAQVIDNEMLPAFRAGQYYQGLDNATTVLMKAARGEFPADKYKKKNDFGAITPFIFFIIFLIIIMFTRGTGGRNQRNIGHKGLPLWLLLSMMNSGRSSHSGSWGGFSGGGGFGGGGGGGFGGFGGGSFGGGGAGGSW